MNHVELGKRRIGAGEPCYLIAEIGSNFDGDLERAKQLATLAAQAGADAAKFQSFLPEKIIRPEGFENPEGFQESWDKPVRDVYADAAFPREWHAELQGHCASLGIDFFSSPYDADAVELLDSLDVPAHKVGSGEIDNSAFLELVARSGRPVLLGCGAAALAEIARAVEVLRGAGCAQLVLLQCVTNYPSTFESADIRAMVQLANAFQVPVGYSDHTPGDVVPLGAVALGACVIEKHFTDDTSRVGPDHSFAMDVVSFRSMADNIRRLELALGNGQKAVAPEEERTRVFQRRGLWSVRPLHAGERLTSADVDVLRPAHGLPPDALPTLLGLEVRVDVPAGTALTMDHFR